MEIQANRALCSLQGIQELVSGMIAQSHDASELCCQSFSKLQSEVTQLHSIVTSTHVSNPIVTSMALEVLNRYLDQAFDLTNQLRASPSKQLERQLQGAVAKLVTIREMLPFAFVHPADDIAVLDPEHERWQRLNSVVNYVQLAPTAQLERSTEALLSRMEVGLAFISKTGHLPKTAANRLLIGAYILLYGISKAKARRRAEYKRHIADLQLVQTTWNMLDSKLGAKLVAMTTPTIKFNQLIYVPRLVPHVAAPPSLEASGHYTQVIAHDANSAGANFFVVQDPGKKRIPVRILSPFPIPAVQQRMRTESRWFCGGSNTLASQVMVSEALVLHFHGGGFVSMSSRSHQNYTRQWAIELNLPVLSVDYALAPDNPFPAAIDDAWQVYSWVIHHAKHYLGIYPKKIVLAGDSAGGFIILGLTRKLIQENERLPDGLLLSYPCTNLSIEQFSPSRVLALEDRLLGHVMVKAVLAAFLKDYDGSADYLLQPASGDLQQFPKCRIIVGDKDPLYDDNVRLADSLREAGVDVKMNVYRDCIHGILSFGGGGGMSVLRPVVADSIAMLKEMLES